MDIKLHVYVMVSIEVGCTVAHMQSQHLGGWGRMITHEDPDQSGLYITSKQKWESVLILTNPQGFPDKLTSDN